MNLQCYATRIGTDYGDTMGLLLAIVFAVVVGAFIVWLAACDSDLTLLFYAKFGKKANQVLRGKVVWITGASSGIGEYLAYSLAAAGCKLVLSARRQEELERVKQQCQRIYAGDTSHAEDTVMVLPLDVLKFDSHKEATEKVLHKYGAIDILVNNAGRTQRAMAAETTIEVDQQVLALNFLGALSLTKAVAPHMIARKSGHVVVNSSVAGKIAGPMSASYVASKFALQGWFASFEAECAASNVTVTVACPGPVETDLIKAAFTGEPDKEYGVHSDYKEQRMTTARCAELMTVAIANQLDEVWISSQPLLLFVYLYTYMPWLGRKLAKTIGMKILHNLRKGN